MLLLLFEQLRDSPYHHEAPKDGTLTQLFAFFIERCRAMATRLQRWMFFSRQAAGNAASGNSFEFFRRSPLSSTSHFLAFLNRHLRSQTTSICQVQERSLFTVSRIHDAIATFQSYG